MHSLWRHGTFCQRLPPSLPRCTGSEIFDKSLETKPSSVHFPDESVELAAKSKIPPILKISDLADPENTTKQADFGGNPGESRDEPEGRDLYKLWAEYYKAQNGHVIQMVTEIVCFGSKTSQSVNGRPTSRDSPAILIDSGSSRSVCGRKWADRWFHSGK